jgi:uncharacterized membrane protein YgcG
MKIFNAEYEKINAEIAGFKMYMETAEEHRLNILNPPDRTPELFEKLFPYAMALGVDNKWCQKFDSVLKQFNYTPQWYGGGGLSTDDLFDEELAIRMKELSRTFYSAIQSAWKDPTIVSDHSSNKSGRSSRSRGSYDWDSGSRGFGRSGGGGGGGGVRGW